jgi:signal transduction histidine kinase/ligand-binding sensor domain-containing protein
VKKLVAAYARVPGLALTVALAICLVPPSATADEIQSLLSDYVLTSWGEKDGLAEGTIWALVQDARGYLWVGGTAGLFRFDGAEFVRIPLGETANEPREVRSLHLARDTSLWIGLTGARGMARLRNGALSTYGEQHGLSADIVEVLLEDQAGTMWAGTDRGLYQLRQERWEPIASGPGASPIDAVQLTRRGDLVAAARNGVFRSRSDSGTFERIGSSDAAAATRSIAVDASDRVWITDSVVGYRPLGAPGAPSRERGRGVRLLRDRAGSFWIGTGGQGLWRIRDQPGGTPLVQRASTLTGFLGDGVGALFEDRDGNIWAGTTQGLNRVSPRKIEQIIDQGLVLAIERNRSGDVWAATANGLVELTATVGDARRTRMLPGERVLALHADRQGHLWAATVRGLVKFANGRRTTVSRWPHPFERVLSISSNGDGHLWIYDAEQGLFRWRAGRLTAVDLPRAVRRTAVTVNHVDRTGREWLGFDGGQLVMVDASGTTRLIDRGSIGTYNAIYEDEQGGIWLGATAGLGRFDGEGLRTLQTGRFSLQDITAVQTDEMGFFWLGTSTGLARVDRGELARAFDDEAPRLRYKLYRRSDGIAGLPRANVGSPRVTRTADGRLWFVTARGITVIDPRTLPPTRAVAPVQVSRVTIDQREFSPLPRMRIPSGSRSLRVDYGVVDLTSAMTARFRYRLEDFDPAWIDANARRQASYTNLAPGSYRFHVMTERDDGTWEEPGALWEFSIDPTFYQTRWFYTSCVIAAAVSVFSAWRLRLRGVRKEFALLLGERARLSREIHDTLLQSLVGVALQCDALASDVDAQSPARQRFVRLRKDIEEHIREARQAIWDLRSPKLERTDLPTALAEALDRTVAGLPIQFSVTLAGIVRPASPRATEQLLRIGQEAVLNAVRHAQPGAIRVEIRYEGSLLHLTIADDGCGFELGRAPDTSDAHYGLASMRERAQAIGGTFTLTSAPGGGTEIRVTAPLPAPGDTDG